MLNVCNDHYQYELADLVTVPTHVKYVNGYPPTTPHNFRPLPSQGTPRVRWCSQPGRRSVFFPVFYQISLLLEPEKSCFDASSNWPRAARVLFIIKARHLLRCLRFDLPKKSSAHHNDLNRGRLLCNKGRAKQFASITWRDSNNCRGQRSSCTRAHIGEASAPPADGHLGNQTC